MPSLFEKKNHAILFVTLIIFSDIHAHQLLNKVCQSYVAF